MSPISEDFAHGLDRLRGAIKRAEDTLAKIPGATVPDVCVPCPICDGMENPEVVYSLGVSVNGKSATILVLEHNRSEGEFESYPLLDAPVGIRVQLSPYVPDLIRYARSQDGELTALIESSIADIDYVIENEDE